MLALEKVLVVLSILSVNNIKIVISISHSMRKSLAFYQSLRNTDGFKIHLHNRLIYFLFALYYFCSWGSINSIKYVTASMFFAVPATQALFFVYPQ